MDNNQLMRIINQNLGIHKNNCKTFIDFIVALQKSRTVNLQQMVNYSSKIGNIKESSIYKGYQRIVHENKLNQTAIAKCILKMYDLSDCKLTLAIDRTNWSYGKKDINLLVLSCCVLDCAIPLYWLELDKNGGCSNNNERQQLLDMFINDLGVEIIDHIVADREFVGKSWFNYLNDNKIPFVIRIKQNMVLNKTTSPIKGSLLFKNATKYAKIQHSIEIDGIPLVAQAVISPEDEMVIVVSNNSAPTEPFDLLDIYAKRWRIECLFANLKTKGFNFEDTHITRKDRIGNLTKLIVLAFAVCYLLGLVRASVKPIIIKKHGYKQHSFFRHGLDFMIQLFNANWQQALYVLELCFSFMKLEHKTRLLICVM